MFLISFVLGAVLTAIINNSIPHSMEWHQLTLDSFFFFRGFQFLIPLQSINKLYWNKGLLMTLPVLIQQRNSQIIYWYELCDSMFLLYCMALCLYTMKPFPLQLLSIPKQQTAQRISPQCKCDDTGKSFHCISVAFLHFFMFPALPVLNFLSIKAEKDLILF